MMKINYRIELDLTTTLPIVLKLAHKKILQVLQTKFLDRVLQIRYTDNLNVILQFYKFKNYKY